LADVCFEIYVKTILDKPPRGLVD